VCACVCVRACVRLGVGVGVVWVVCVFNEVQHTSYIRGMFDVCIYEVCSTMPPPLLYMCYMYDL